MLGAFPFGPGRFTPLWSYLDSVLFLALFAVGHLNPHHHHPSAISTSPCSPQGSSTPIPIPPCPPPLSEAAKPRRLQSGKLPKHTLQGKSAFQDRIDIVICNNKTTALNCALGKIVTCLVFFSPWKKERLNNQKQNQSQWRNITAGVQQAGPNAGHLPAGCQSPSPSRSHTSPSLLWKRRICSTSQ